MHGRTAGEPGSWSHTARRRASGPYLDSGHESEVADENDAQLCGHVLHDGPALAAQACGRQQGRGASTGFCLPRVCTEPRGPQRVGSWRGQPAPKCPSPQDPGAWAPRGCRHRTAAAARAARRAQGGAGALRAREARGAEMSKPQGCCFQHIRPPGAAPVWSAQMWPEYALLSHGSRQRASRVLPHPLPWQALGPPTITWSQCKGVNA